MDSDEEEERLLREGQAELAQFILSVECQKKGCIKEADLRKVLAEVPATGGKRTRCIDRTIEYLEEVFGVKVCKTQTLQGIRLYIGNALETKDDTFSCLENSEEEKAKYGVLIAVLMFIYMMCRPGSFKFAVSEKTLRNFLKEVGLTQDGCFLSQTDLNRLLGTTPSAEFVAQGWLAYTKGVDESGNDVITYEWGPRAKAFIDPMTMLRAFCTVDGSAPQQWKSYYQQATQKN